MRNYRDLVVWEKAYRLTLAIQKNMRSFPNDERFGLTSQMRRASASISANLAEGCGRRSDGEMGRLNCHITSCSRGIWAYSKPTHMGA
jgi:four helix bundle protein